jgi:DNA-binding transcriptional MerR regulator
MKMQELERRTGVDREVIRIMLRERLLPQPHRPTRNSAEYDETHVTAVGAVRELQQSSRMTLREIKAALDANGLNGAGPVGAFRHIDALLGSRFGRASAPPVSLSAIEANHPEARHDAEAFEALEMLQIDRAGPDEALSMWDARLVEIWGEIRKAGFVEETGYPPENIAFYLEAAKMVARNEFEIFFGQSKVPITHEQSANMLHVALPLMLDFFGLLRLKAFFQLLQERQDPSGDS